MKKTIFKTGLIFSFLFTLNLNAGIAKKIAHKTIKYPDGSIKKGGHRNWRNNNPGNLEYGNFTVKNGAIGTDGRFAIFESMEDGFKAQVALLKTNRYSRRSIRSAIHMYAPSFENNTGRYIRKITKSLNVSSRKRLASLNRKQLLKMVKSMAAHEGMRKGIVLNKKQRTFFQKFFSRK